MRSLDETALLDTLPEAAFDRLTRLAATLLHAPVALISLVDDRRQFFKSAHGLALRETPLEPLVLPAGGPQRRAAGGRGRPPGRPGRR